MYVCMYVDVCMYVCMRVCRLSGTKDPYNLHALARGVPNGHRLCMYLEHNIVGSNPHQGERR
jgi:hypothetical protein